MEYGSMDSLVTFFGTASSAAIIDATVPPDMPTTVVIALVESPKVKYSPFDEGPKDFKVLLAKYAEMSEGTESNPQAGTMIEPVLVAK